MARFLLAMTDDGLARIVDLHDPAPVGRALTEADGEALVELLNRLAARQSQELRDRVLSEVADAVENCFDGVA